MTKGKWIPVQGAQGKHSKQAHADLPEGTYEREMSKEGFFGPAAFFYHPKPPTGWVNFEGPLRPRAFDLVKDQSWTHSPWDAPVILSNKATEIRFWKSHAMSGLRTGYVITRAPLLQDRIPKLLRCTVNGVNTLAQWAAVAAVRGGDANTIGSDDLHLQHGARGGVEHPDAFAERAGFERLTLGRERQPGGGKLHGNAGTLGHRQRPGQV